MPEVTVGVPSSASALPIATTESPTSSVFESPSCTVGRFVGPIFTTARSCSRVDADDRRGRGARVGERDLDRERVGATSAFVTMTPSLSTMNPVPVPWPSGPLTSMRTTAGCTLRRIAWMSPLCTMTDAGRSAAVVEVEEAVVVAAERDEGAGGDQRGDERTDESADEGRAGAAPDRGRFGPWARRAREGSTIREARPAVAAAAVRARADGLHVGVHRRAGWAHRRRAAAVCPARATRRRRTGWRRRPWAGRRRAGSAGLGAQGCGGRQGEIRPGGSPGGGTGEPTEASPGSPGGAVDDPGRTGEAGVGWTTSSPWGGATSRPTEPSGSTTVEAGSTFPDPSRSSRPGRRIVARLVLVRHRSSVWFRTF